MGALIWSPYRWGGTRLREDGLSEEVREVGLSKGGTRLSNPLRTWLEAPRSSAWSVAAWAIATLLFVSLTLLLGGPSQADSGQSIYTAVLMAHGDWSCAYPPLASSHLNGTTLTFLSPMYTLLSAVAARLLDLGAGTPFPSVAHLGVHCSNAMGQVAAWVEATNTLRPLILLGLISWIVLAGGLVATMRVSRQRRDGWEALLLVVVACSPPVLSCLEWSFHPEDIMAMGLILFAMTSLMQERWWLVGVLMGVALLTQLFALLALIPLAMVTPRRQRFAVASGIAGLMVLVVTPLELATSGAVLHSIFFGTSKVGGAHFGGAGGTVISSAGLHGVTLFLMSRIAPLLTAALVTFLVMKKWGDQVRRPVILASLIATCLTLRLAFEVNALGYYYMAATVSLLLIDALQGRFRGESFALIALIALAYSPVTQYFRWRGHFEGTVIREALPYLVSIPVVVMILAGLAYRRLKWHWVLWQVVVIVAFIRFPIHPHGDTGALPSWCWQLLLVSSLLLILSRPLRAATTRLPREVASP